MFAGGVGVGPGAKVDAGGILGWGYALRPYVDELTLTVLLVLAVLSGAVD